MIVEKLTQEELCLVEILRHPLWANEFLREIEPSSEESEPIEYADYQRDILCDFSNFVNLTCGRSIGKCLHKDSKILNTLTGEYQTVEYWFNSNKNLRIPALDVKNMKQVIDTNDRLSNINKFVLLHFQ